MFLPRKAKRGVAKKWEFYVQLRMYAMVLCAFVSENGVFNAGLAIGVLLLSLIGHSFILPFKDERSNTLETCVPLRTTYRDGHPALFRPTSAPTTLETSLRTTVRRARTRRGRDDAGGSSRICEAAAG